MLDAGGWDDWQMGGGVGVVCKSQELEVWICGLLGGTREGDGSDSEVP